MTWIDLIIIIYNRILLVFFKIKIYVIECINFLNYNHNISLRNMRIMYSNKNSKEQMF